MLERKKDTREGGWGIGRRKRDARQFTSYRTSYLRPSSASSSLALAQPAQPLSTNHTQSSKHDVLDYTKTISFSYSVYPSLATSLITLILSTDVNCRGLCHLPRFCSNHLHLHIAPPRRNIDRPPHPGRPRRFRRRMNKLWQAPLIPVDP